MTDATLNALLNWMHQVTAVTQELAAQHKMAAHADTLAAAARELADCLQNEAVEAKGKAT